MESSIEFNQELADTRDTSTASLFETLTLQAAWKIIYEILRAITSNPKVFNYIKSGKADYFGIDEEEEMWEDIVLFRPNKYAQFINCFEYISVELDIERADRVQYLLIKLKTTFRDLEDEKVLNRVRDFISTFTNNHHG
jgi:hypothetical protein